MFFLRDYAQRAAEQAFDRLLAASALTIAGSVQIEDNGVTAVSYTHLDVYKRQVAATATAAERSRRRFMARS